MGCRKWIKDPRTNKAARFVNDRTLVLSFPLLQNDADRVQDINLSSTTRARQPTYGPCITRSNQLDAQACSVYSFGLGEKWSVFDYPRGYPYTFVSTATPSQHRHQRTRYPQPDGLAIKTVTPITCHQSQIMGESTCPMDACIPSGKQIDPLMSLTTSMIWLTFRGPESQNIAR